MADEGLLDLFRQEAKTLEGVDVDVYRHWDLEVTEPIIGEGPAGARLAIFGRDPGREEVRWRQPFIGAGGQKVRQELYRALYNQPMPDFEASVAVGAYVFWANTVPYKPLGNKAWSQKVKRRFLPLMTRILLETWEGTDVLTLGREAFLWFGLGLERPERQALEQFWRQPNRFESSYPITLGHRETGQRTLRLHPLPHPSPLNATWYKKFPDLLQKRLQELNFGLDSWALPES